MKKKPCKSFPLFVLILVVLLISKTIVHAAADTTGPYISDLSVSPNQVNIGDSITVSARISDTSGVRDGVTVQIVSSAGNVAGGVLQRISGDNKDGIYQGTYTIPSGYSAGQWEAVIYADDIYGNFCGYSSNSIYFTVNDVISISSIIREPTAKDITANGNNQYLVNAGEAKDGVINYALGYNTSSVPLSGWSPNIPTASAPGTYYVWYKVVGDIDHWDTEPKCITVIISPDNNNSSSENNTSQNKTSEKSKEFTEAKEEIDSNLPTVKIQKIEKGKKSFTIKWKKSQRT